MSAASQSVLFFLCLNDRGGAEQSMIALAKGMKARGCAVTLAVYGSQPWLARDYGFDGQIIDLRVRRTAVVLIPLARLLRARPFSHVISALSHTNLVVCLASFGLPVRLVVTEHGGEGLAAARQSWFFGFLVRFFYRLVFARVAVSQTLATQWYDFLRGRVDVDTIYNPVVPDITPVSMPAAHPWLEDKKVPVIIGVGRLAAIKNFDLLLRAFALLVETRAARLVILGEGVERLALLQTAQELGIADRVLLSGFVTDTQAWLPYARLFVSPSNREGLGNALIEALAAGVPVVATDCPYGPAEILAGGLYGRLVPVGDVAALAQAMAQALDQDPEKDRAARQKRAQDFSVSASIDSYLALVEVSVSR